MQIRKKQTNKQVQIIDRVLRIKYQQQNLKGNNNCITIVIIIIIIIIIIIVIIIFVVAIILTLLTIQTLLRLNSI